MNLFTKSIDKQLFAQYPKGSDLENQMVVAKIFNPYGRGVWYLLNSDPEDPDYIWAIVDLFEPDMGSVSRSELQTVKLPPFGLGFERDIYFTPKPAKEVWEGVMRGERFAHGGMTAGRYYKDNSGKEFRFIGESEGKLLFKDGEKIITKSHEDFEDAPKEKKLFGIFDEGGETEDEGVDLFEDYDEIPKNVQKILEKYDFEEGDYRTLEKAKKDVEKVGYTFEYSLDGTAYDLRKIGQKGKSGDEYAKGGETQEYIVWVSKDGEKRELFGEYKSKRAADMQMNKLWPKGEYKQMGNKPKSMYEKEGFYADGGETAAAEHNIKQAKYGARLVGKQKNLDVNKNGKLDAEDFKILRGKKMAMGGKVKKDFKVGDKVIYAPNGKWFVRNNPNFKNGVITNKEIIGDLKITNYTIKINNGSEIMTSNTKEIEVNPDKMAMGGKVKFEDKVKAVKESLLKRKKVSPKVQKDYGKTYDRKEALEAAKRIVGAQTAKYELKKKFKKGGKTIAQTPAPKKDRVFGSSKNKSGSASSKKAASNIELNESILKTLSQKAKEYNEKHSSKVSTSTLKAVMRRGMGAYSTSHRPTITGGAPNSRQAWGFARVNKFLLKKGGTKVKAAYVQDDDLL